MLLKYLILHHVQLSVLAQFKNVVRLTVDAALASLEFMLVTSAHTLIEIADFSQNFSVFSHTGHELTHFFLFNLTLFQLVFHELELLRLLPIFELRGTHLSL